MGVILEWGGTAFPAALDSVAGSFPTLVDTVHDIIASHPNSLADAVDAIEAKVGIDNSAVATSHDYQLRQGRLTSQRAGGDTGSIAFLFDTTNAHLDSDILLSLRSAGNERFRVGGGAADDVYLDLGGGSTAPISAAGRGRIRYNEALSRFEVSENGGAWTDISTALGTTLQNAYDAVAGNTIVIDASGAVYIARGASSPMGITDYALRVSEPVGGVDALGPLLMVDSARTAGAPTAAEIKVTDISGTALVLKAGQSGTGTGVLITGGHYDAETYFQVHATGRMGLGIGASASSTRIHTYSTGNADRLHLEIEYQYADSATGGEIRSYRHRGAAGQALDELGEYTFYGQDSTYSSLSPIKFAGLRGIITTATAGSHEGEIEVRIAEVGSDVEGMRLQHGGIRFPERATVPNAPAAWAGYGTYWVKNDVPSTPYFTDDTGVDHLLAYSGAGAGTLDASYDFGGAGAGRSITADAGAVVITNAVVDATNALELNRTGATGIGAALQIGLSAAPAAGVSSGRINFVGQTSAALRTISMINEADVGTDTYRLRINDNGGGQLAVLHATGRFDVTTVLASYLYSGVGSAAAITVGSAVGNGFFFPGSTETAIASAGVETMRFASGLTTSTLTTAGTSGPELRLFLDKTAAGAAYDIAGSLTFWGKDSAGATVRTGRVYAYPTNATSPNHLGRLVFDYGYGGTFNTAGSIGADGLWMYTTAIAFQTAAPYTISNGYHTDATISTSATRLDLTGTAGTIAQAILSHTPGVTTGAPATGPEIQLYLNRTDAALDGDVAGRITFYAEDDSAVPGAKTQFGEIAVVASDVSNLTEDGYLNFKLMDAGTLKTVLNLMSNAVGSAFFQSTKTMTAGTTAFGFTMTDDAAVDEYVFFIEDNAATPGGGATLFMINGIGQTLGVAGAASTPTYSFATDTNSGLFSGGDGVVSCSANGSTFWTVSSPGGGMFIYAVAAFNGRTDLTGGGSTVYTTGGDTPTTVPSITHNATHTTLAGTAIGHRTNATFVPGAASTAVYIGVDHQVAVNHTSAGGSPGAYTAHRIQIIETALGGTGHQIADWQVGGSTRFAVDRIGNLFLTNLEAAALGPEIQLYQNSASPAAADVVGRVSFHGEDEQSVKTEYARINGFIGRPNHTVGPDNVTTAGGMSLWGRGGTDGSNTMYEVFRAYADQFANIIAGTSRLYVSYIYAGGLGFYSDTGTLSIVSGYSFAINIDSVTLQHSGSFAQASGTTNAVSHTIGFAPASGTAVFNGWNTIVTVNQTGGANGTITINRMAVSETAVVGSLYLADWYAGTTGTEARFRVDRLGNMSIQTNDNGATFGPTFTLYRAHTDDIANNDELGCIQWDSMDDTTPIRVTYGQLVMKVTNFSGIGATFVWRQNISAAMTDTMTLDETGGLSVRTDIGDGSDPVNLMDDFDDAMVLRDHVFPASRQRSKESLDRLCAMGVFSRANDGGYMVGIKPMLALVGGAAYQNREQIDMLKAQVADLQDRIAKLEAAA